MDPNGGKSKHLINRLGREELVKKLEEETFDRKVVSFYRYVYLTNPAGLRDQLYATWSELGCLGRIYLAEEGINAQMSVPVHNWDAFVSALYAHPEFDQVPFKVGVEQDRFAFLKLIIKLRKQIVADGLPTREYDVTNVGTHLDAESWNAALETANPIVVDMRNYYESEVGHF